MAYLCPICGREEPVWHALETHVGMRHPGKEKRGWRLKVRKAMVETVSSGNVGSLVGSKPTPHKGFQILSVTDNIPNKRARVWKEETGKP